MISHGKAMLEDTYPNKFFFRISPDLSDQETYAEFKKISQTPLNELHKMCDNARDYFKTVVVEYFKDPTKMFLETL